MRWVARCLFHSRSQLPPGSLMGLYYLLSTTQTGLKKFLEYVQLGTSDKVARLLDKGLDPNYHDSDSGGRDRGQGLGREGVPSTRPGGCM